MHSHNYNFKALGTVWNIIIDEPNVNVDKAKILKVVNNFESNYSRFIDTSLVSQFNSGKKINNKEFQSLLTFGQEIEKASNGYFTSNSGKILTKLGYGSGIQGLDFGAFGKGWLIDKIANYLKKHKIKYFMVNAGGDIFATQKIDHSSWVVALEHPIDRTVAIGTIKIKNQALAASSPFKRSWNNYNHLINGKTGKSIIPNKAVFTISDDAKTADALATTINIMPNELIDEISKKYSTQYLIISDEKIIKSKNFTGTLF